jgi:hypothetical protein
LGIICKHDCLGAFGKGYLSCVQGGDGNEFTLFLGLSAFKNQFPTREECTAVFKGRSFKPIFFNEEYVYWSSEKDSFLWVLKPLMIIDCI